MKSQIIVKVGVWVEVLSRGEILSTLDEGGRLEGLPFMPEMAPYCGKRFEITAVMDKICGGGPGMRAVAGAPLLLLDELRCEGSSHGGCSRLCTFLWKAAWLKPVDDPSAEPAMGLDETTADWPYPTRTTNGTYQCQATALAHATVPMSVAEKLGKALTDLVAGNWDLGQFLKAYSRAVCYRVRSLYSRLLGKPRQAQSTPNDRLGIQPGEWVETKSLSEISTTLDRNHKNKGLMFSIYMVPYCGGKYQVKSRMGKFIDEHTGGMRELKHTVILQGVICKGETTSGMCRRAECLYWREIWLKRAENPEERMPIVGPV